MQIVGYVDIISRSVVTGWIADKDAPIGALQVSILVNGEVEGHAIANEFRSDLVNAFEGASGRYCFRFNFIPPLSAFDTHEVAVVIGHNLLPSRQWTRTIPSIAQPALPILVTSAGRSGSTLMMNRLSAHPDVLLVAEHPAEVKLLTYYAGAMRALTSPADPERSTHPSTIMTDRFSIGFNPFHDNDDHPLFETYWERTVPLTLAHSFRELILAYYDTVRLTAGKPVPRYIAEKAQPDPLIRQCAIFMFGAVREIVLLRDPRDLLCSYHSFWKTDLVEAQQTIVSQLVPLLALWKKSLSCTLFIKYEDMTRQSVATMEKVYDFLDLPSVQATDDVELFGRHGTSRTVEASVGRWRTDLPLDVIASCQKKFAPFLAAFGYRDSL